MLHRRGLTLIDLLIASAILAIGATLLLAAAGESAEYKRRVKCASNLRQIGLAMMLYANENRGAFPRTMYAPQNPTPTWGTPYQGDPTLGPVRWDAREDASPDPFAADDKPNTKYRPAANDVTAALFLIMRTQDIAIPSFLCPTAQLKKWDFGGGAHTALGWTNWPGNKGIAQHLSYSYANPYGSKDAVARGFRLNNVLGAEFVLASDMNPGGEAVTALTVQSPADEMRKGNSLNHGQEGQNALFADAHIEFQQNPFIGVMRDNIFTFNGPEIENRTGPSGIVGSPADEKDSVLLPTAADVGFVAPPPIPDQPGPAPEALRAKLVGRYALTSQWPGQGLLVIDEKSITLTHGPATAVFEYDVIGLTEDSELELRLRGKDMAAEAILLTPDDNGGYLLRAGERTPWAFLMGGEWKRMK